MPVSREREGGEAVVREPKQAFGIKEASILPNKRTINLCMRERGGLSAQAFLIILAAILIVAIAVELVGAYMPYRRLERTEEELAATRAALAAKQEKTKDFDAVREYYNQYNYVGFDRSIADRLDVLAVLEREIMNSETFGDKARLRTVSIAGRTVSMTIDGLDKDEISKLEENLLKDPLIEGAWHSQTGYSGDVPFTNMTLTLTDASTLPSAAQ